VFSSNRRPARNTEVEILRAKIEALESARSVSEATARLEQMLLGGLQRIASDNAARDSVVEHLWHKVIDREHDLAAAIEHLLDVSEALADRLDAQDREQRVLVDLLRVGLQRLEPGPAKPIEADVIDLDEPRRGDEWHTAS
jgi:hypothetical protein